MTLEMFMSITVSITELFYSVYLHQVFYYFFSDNIAILFFDF